MDLKRKTYPIVAYIRHLFTSWNTGGEGIHSPYLFYLVRMLFYDDNRYYCWQEIEQVRRDLLRSKESIRVIDYGTGGAPDGKHEVRNVSDIARHSLEQSHVAQILFRLATYIGHVQQRPLHIVELGTSLGITTAYLAKPDSRNQVITYEGSPEVARIAQNVWKKLGISNIQLVLGAIDDTLINTRVQRARGKKQVDLAFIDANHTREATIRYYDFLRQMAHEGSIFAIDDIHHSPEMEQAWQEICHREEVTTTMDLFHFGLVFFDKHYLRRNYKLRI